MVHPSPIFATIAQSLSYGILENIICLRHLLMMISQAMIEKVTLPGNLMKPGEIFLPLAYGSFHSRLTWECDDRVQMIGHEQHQTTMPLETCMVVGSRRKDRVTQTGPAKVIMTQRFAINRDEKETAVGNPLRHLVRKPPPFRQVHRMRIKQTSDSA